MLSIAVSTRALFHIEDGNHIYESQGQEAFDEYMLQKADVPLRPGTAFPLVRKLLALNKPDRPRLVDVVVLSRNSPAAGIRIGNSIVSNNLDIKSIILCKGTDRFRYAAALGVHLFLSANHKDVETAIKHGIAAATLMPSERDIQEGESDIRIAFDGDSVLFSDEADKEYLEHGLEHFHKTELEKASTPLPGGPFKRVLEEFCNLRRELGADCPVRLGLVTARGVPSHGRVLNTLRSWNLVLDEAIFANGAPKGPLLKAFGADIFFDDAQKNISSACENNIPSGHVPFGHGGIVRDAQSTPAPTPTPQEAVLATA